MAEKETKTKARKNSVHIVGYLKENTLEDVTNNDGKRSIRGNLVIATDDLNSHKVQFYMNEKNKDGEENSDFAKMLELLPNKTTTIASFLKDHPGENYEVAKNASTKVWAQARLEEYASQEGERITSIVTIKGFKAGLKDASDTFKPCANFTIDLYIGDVVDEVEYDGETPVPTGRVILRGLIPMYDKSVQSIDFVAPVEDNIAGYVKANYKKGQTTTINGEIISIQEQVKKENDDAPACFGRPNEVQYSTRFIRERRILGGSASPIKQGEEGCITNAEIKEGLAARALKMAENGKKAKANKEAKENSEQKEAPKKQQETGAAPKGFSDEDFTW